MAKKECVAMLLAGGQGKRLMALTANIAKPAVSFGGKYRIIDFVLSNCANSAITTVGILTQYRPYLLHSYVGTGEAWNLDERGGGAAILPPYQTQEGAAWYEGTADAIYRNIEFLEEQDAEYVLILSGDQLYRMDYADMLRAHKEAGADLTVSVMEVPWEEAPRFGIMTTDDEDNITEFNEKPEHPNSNLASMGIYIFNNDLLLSALRAEKEDPNTTMDFGGDIIPKLLAQGKKLLAYRFAGYWRDVGTVASYHETALELLGDEPEFDLYQDDFPIMSNTSVQPPHYIGPNAKIDDALISNGCRVFGTVKHSILSDGAYVGESATVVDSVLLPGARVEDGAQVINAILGEGATVQAGATFGSADPDAEIALVGDDAVVGKE